MTTTPLIFEPIFKPKIWGGRRLESVLGKKLPQGEPIGESWEIADLENDQSVVSRGPMKGKTLRNLIETWGEDLLGRSPLFEGRFPLLIKFLDATETLSVQVHPDEALAKERGGETRIKNEAWYVIGATEDACIYRSLIPGTTRDQLIAAIDEDRIEPLLQRIPVKKGQCYYLPSGTIHALGGGALVAEVQTPSDITYRVFDWNRVEQATGKPRTLHKEDAKRCISLEGVPPETEKQQHLASVWTTVTSLVRCESFVIERTRMVAGVQQPIPYNEMVIWIVLEGQGEITCKGLTAPLPFEKGDTILLPAALQDGSVKTDTGAMWLEASLPIQSSLAGYDRPSAEELREPEGTGFVPLGTPRKGGNKQ